MRILVLRALGLGDLLTAVPALRALRDAYPRADLVLACPPWLHELVDLWDLAEPLSAEELQPLPWARARFDLAVNLHGRGPESTRLLLDLLPLRVLAFRHPDVAATHGFPAWRQGEHEVERWCRLLTELGIEANPRRLDLDRPSGRIGSDRGCTIVHPGAKAPSRRWPPERFAEVARSEARAGRRVVVTGSAEEHELCLRVASLAGLPRARVRTRGSLVDLATLVGAAGLVVSGDTGIAHLATALRTPSVVLFGPVSPDEWGPPKSRRRLHRALWAGLPGEPGATGPDRNLLEITPARVLSEIADLRAAARPRRRAPARA